MISMWNGPRVRSSGTGIGAIIQIGLVSLVVIVCVDCEADF